MKNVISQNLGKEREKRWDLRRERKMERDGAEVACDGRLFHRRAAATGNALSPTVDSRMRRTARDTDEAERSRCLTSVSAGIRQQ